MFLGIMSIDLEDKVLNPVLFNSSRPDPGRREKIYWNFCFHFYGASKGFIKALKFQLIFTLMQLSEIHGPVRVPAYILQIIKCQLDGFVVFYPVRIYLCKVKNGSNRTMDEIVQN